MLVYKTNEEVLRLMHVTVILAAEESLTQIISRLRTLVALNYIELFSRGQYLGIMLHRYEQVAGPSFSKIRGFRTPFNLYSSISHPEEALVHK